MTSRDAYLAAAEKVAALLREPEVAAAWDRPSALEAFTVRGLAGHLAIQTLMLDSALDAPDSDLPAIPLAEHYARVAWIDAPVDSEVNALIRAGGDRAAQEGPGELAAQVDEAVRRQRAALPAAAADHRVTAPSGQWSLVLDDFVLTRAMEIAVHGDDLAVSVGLPTPAIDDDALMPVITLLARIALRRHGQVALLRALSRRERAPASVSAF
jgi:hypothetical protein